MCMCVFMLNRWPITEKDTYKKQSTRPLKWAFSNKRLKCDRTGKAGPGFRLTLREYSCSQTTLLLTALHALNNCAVVTHICQVAPLRVLESRARGPRSHSHWISDLWLLLNRLNILASHTADLMPFFILLNIIMLIPLL